MIKVIDQNTLVMTSSVETTWFFHRSKEIAQMEGMELRGSSQLRRKSRTIQGTLHSGRGEEDCLTLRPEAWGEKWIQIWVNSTFSRPSESNSLSYLFTMSTYEATDNWSFPRSQTDTVVGEDLSGMVSPGVYRFLRLRTKNWTRDTC